MKKRTAKLLSLLLASTMFFSSLNLTALATEIEQTAQETVETVDADTGLYLETKATEDEGSLEVNEKTIHHYEPVEYLNPVDFDKYTLHPVKVSYYEAAAEEDSTERKLEHNAGYPIIVGANVYENDYNSYVSHHSAVISIDGGEKIELDGNDIFASHSQCAKDADTDNWYFTATFNLGYFDLDPNTPHTVEGYIVAQISDTSYQSNYVKIPVSGSFSCWPEKEKSETHSIGYTGVAFDSDTFLTDFSLILDKDYGTPNVMYLYKHGDSKQPLATVKTVKFEKERAYNYRYSDEFINAGLVVNPLGVKYEISDNWFKNIRTTGLKSGDSIDLVVKFDSGKSYTIENYEQYTGSSSPVNTCEIKSTFPASAMMDAGATAEVEVLLSGDQKYVARKPIFSTSNPKVLSVNVDPTNPKKATFTALTSGYSIVSVKVGTDKVYAYGVNVYSSYADEAYEFSSNKIIHTINKDEENSFDNYLVSNDSSEKIIEAKDIAKINYTFSNPDIVSIAPINVDANSYCKIQVKEVGTTEILAKFKLKGDDKEYSAKFTVEARKDFDESDDYIYKNLYSSNNFKVLLFNERGKNTTTLKSIKIADGWRWENENEVIKADDNRPYQYYTAIYERPGYGTIYESVCLSVSMLKSIKLDGPAQGVKGRTFDSPYYVSFDFTGYQIKEWELDDYKDVLAIDFSESENATYLSNWIWTNDDSEAEPYEEPLGFKFEAANAVNNNEITSAVDGKIIAKIKGTSFSVTKNIKILPTPGVDWIVVGDELEQINGGDASLVYDINASTKTHTLAASPLIDSASINEDSDIDALMKLYFKDMKKILKWSSSDTSVVSIKALPQVNDVNGHLIAYGSQVAELTIKKAGTAVINIAATDASNYVQSIVIEVVDTTPVIETSNIAMNMYSTKETDLGLVSQNGNTIVAVDIDEKAKPFFAKPSLKDGIWVTKCISQDTQKLKKPYSTKLIVTTVDGKDTEIPVTFKVSTTMPKIKTTAVSSGNLFFANSDVEVSVTATDKITNITSNSDKYDVSFVNTNSESYLLTLTPKRRNLSDLKKLTGNVSVPLTIEYANYSTQVNDSIKVKALYKKPSYMIKDIILTEDYDSATTVVIDKTSGVNVSCSKSLADTTPKVELTDTGDNNLTVRRLIKAAKVTYKVKLHNDNWIEDIIADGKVLTEAKQSLNLDKKLVYLNTTLDTDHASISAPLKSLNEISEYNIEPANDISAEAVKSGFIRTYYNSNEKVIGFSLGKNTNGRFDNFINNRNKTYSFKVAATDIDGHITGSTNVSVKLATVAPATKIKVSKTLNVADKMSFVTASYTLANTSNPVEWIYVDGKYANDFYITTTVNGFRVYANDWAKLEANKVYPITIVMGNSDYKIKTTVNVKTNCKAPKLTVSGSTLSFRKSNLAITRTALFNFSDSNQTHPSIIEEIELVNGKNNDCFDVEFNEIRNDNNELIGFDGVTVALTEKGKTLRPGKYTLSFKARTNNMATNSKPYTFTITAVVK